MTGCVGCAPPHRPCLGTLGTPPSTRDPTGPARLCFGPPRRVASWSRSGAKDSTHGSRAPRGNISRARSLPAIRTRNACKSSSRSTAPYRLRYQTHSSNARSTAARSHATSRSCSATNLALRPRRLHRPSRQRRLERPRVFRNVAIRRSLPSITASFRRSSSSINRSFSTTLSSFRNARFKPTSVRSTCSPMIAPAVASSVRSRSTNSRRLGVHVRGDALRPCAPRVRTDVLHLPNTAATRKNCGVGFAESFRSIAGDVARDVEPPPRAPRGGEATHANVRVQRAVHDLLLVSGACRVGEVADSPGVDAPRGQLRFERSAAVKGGRLGVCVFPDPNRAPRLPPRAKDDARAVSRRLLDVAAFLGAR